MNKKKKYAPELALQDFIEELAKEAPDLSRFEGVKIAMPNQIIDAIIAPYNGWVKSDPHRKKAYKAYTFTIEQFKEPSSFYEVVIMQMAFGLNHKDGNYGSSEEDSIRLKIAADAYIRRRMRAWADDGGLDFYLPVYALKQITCIQDEFFKWYDGAHRTHIAEDLRGVVDEVCRTKLLLTADKQKCIHTEDRATLLRIAEGFEMLASRELLKVYTGYAGSGKSTNARFYMKNKGLIKGCVVTLANLIGRDLAKKANAMGLRFIQASISKCMHCGIQRVAGGDVDGIVIDEFSQWGAVEMDVLWSIINYCLSENTHLFILGDTHQIPSFLGRGNFLSGLCQRFQGLHTTNLSEPDVYTTHIIKNVIHRQDGEQEKEDIISYIKTGDIATFFSKHGREDGEWLKVFKKIADLSIQYEVPLNDPTDPGFKTAVDECTNRHVFLTGGNINTDYQNIIILRHLFELTGTPLCKRLGDNTIDYLATLKQMYTSLPYGKGVFIPLIGTASYVETSRNTKSGKTKYVTRVRNKDRLVLLYIDTNNKGLIYNDTTGDLFSLPMEQSLRWISNAKLCNAVLPIDKNSGCKTAQLGSDGKKEVTPCITFGYSINVNNSQGMEWHGTDLIFHRRFTDMQKQGSPDYNIMNYEAYYVAITRHKTEFRVLNNSKTIFKQVNPKRFVNFFNYKEM